MKAFQIIAISVLSLFAPLALEAQTISETRSVTAMAAIGYNKTFRTYAGIDVLATIPTCDYFAAEAALEALTAGSFSASASLRPGISVGKGRFFLDGRLLYRAILPSETSEFAGGVMAGYKRQYFSLQIGGYWRNVYDLTKKSGAMHNPVDLLYKFSFCVRPMESRWNIGAAAANFTPYEFERIWLTMFFLEGHYDITDQLTTLGEICLKPTGMYSMQTTFYGFTFRAGITYKF